MSARELPLISVVIPSFNKGDLILSTIASIKASTYEGPFEIIIVDDNSTDSSTKEAYVKIKRKYPDIRIEESGGKGPGNARNKGLGIAAGEFILFLDSDDLVSSQYVTEAYSCLIGQDQRCAYAYGDVVFFGSTLEWHPTSPYSDSRLRIANYIPVTCLYRAAALREIGGMCTTLRAMEDWDMLLSLSDKGYVGIKISSDANALLLYRHGDVQSVNSSVNHVQRIALRREILRKHGAYNLLSEFWNVASVLYAALGLIRGKKAEEQYSLLPDSMRKSIAMTIGSHTR
jgi:glycosyltransferase involved in cell wall biosynthesis